MIFGIICAFAGIFYAHIFPRLPHYTNPDLDNEHVRGQTIVILTMRTLSKVPLVKHRNDIVAARRQAALQQMEDLRLNLSLALPHELRTPLNAILGYSEYILSRGSDRLPEADTMLRIQSSIYNNALRLQHLIDNYLLYAHLKLLEHNPEKREREMWESHEAVHTNALISSLALGKASKANRQADLHLHLEEANLRIGAKSLHKIVDELLDNAFKFSASGTPVQIVTEVTPTEWRLRIVDHGRGMTPEQIANIGAFMQFDRLHYEQQGAGLGLTIVDLLARLNHGTLTITSTPHEGTMITVAFPPANSPQEDPHANQSARG